METKYFSEFEPIEVNVENQVVYEDINDGFIYWPSTLNMIADYIYQ